MSKVTKEAINAKITDVSFIHLPGTTVTICSITLENGYSVRGESACVDPMEYVEAVGRDLAYQNAFDKIWPLEGYLLVEQRATAPAPREENAEKQNLLAEHAALGKQLDTLGRDLVTAASADSVYSARALGLMRRQYNAMQEYQDALELRIKAL